MLILLAIALLLIAGISIFLNQPSFGKLPQGDRLARIEQSPNYRDGKFQNRTPTQVMADKPKLQGLIDFVFRKTANLRPEKNLPAIKTDLKNLNLQEELFVWMGHSSIYLQTSDKRILVDPVLVSASPISFFNKAFKGTNIYQPEDMPDVDYLVLTHDHWDHLDYNTMLNLRNRVGKVICPLGVGEHLEYWGFDPSSIVELDWNEAVQLETNLKLTALPARHFSGRGLTGDKTLWASYMLQSDFGNIYLSGDSGYDYHYQQIKEQFGTIDFAFMENGQYNEDWKNIHNMPERLIEAIQELAPKKLMTIHNSKYALGKHAWHEPLENISKAAEHYNFNLITPKIGEVVNLNDTTQTFGKWWKETL